MGKIHRWDLRVDESEYETPERARRAIERLLAKLGGQKDDLVGLRKKMLKLDEDLHKTLSAWRAERDLRESSERASRVLVGHFEERVREELEKREEAMRRQNAALQAEVKVLTDSVEGLESELRTWKTDFDSRVAEKKKAYEEELATFRARAKELHYERDRLEKETAARKKLLDDASSAWDDGLEEMRRQLKAREKQYEEEYARKLEVLNRTKERFQQEAEWLQSRVTERQQLWETRLAGKEERIGVLEEKLGLLQETLEEKERQFRETLKSMADALEKARKKPEKPDKDAPTRKDVPTKPLPEQKKKSLAEETDYGRRDLLGSQVKLGGITPQDLVFGIAHQIRNPLAIIRSHAEFCIRKLNPKKKDREPLEAIIRNTHSLGRRLDDLVDLTRPRSLHVQPTSLGPILEQICILMQARCDKQGVTLEQSFPTELEPVPVDTEQFKEGILHVLMNALEAMPDGGTLRIEVEPLHDKELARINVSDTGGGIAQEHLREIFRPFFSSKPGGVGLGLTLAAQIMGLHGGGIEADSEMGKGTVVRCYLPMKRG